jgi:succinoglycan biosynthesis transport protein ExoP
MQQPDRSSSVESSAVPAPGSQDGIAQQKDTRIADFTHAQSEYHSLSLPGDTTYWQLLREHRAVILACTALAALAAGVASLLQSPSYTSNVDIVIGKEESFFAPTEANAIQPFTATMRDLLHSEIVAARVAARLGDGTTPPELLTSYSTSTNPATALLHVTVTADSRRRAIRIATLLGNVFPELVEERFRSESRRGSRGEEAISAVVWNAGRFRAREVPPPLLVNVLLGVLVGLILGIGAAIVRHYRNRGIANADSLSDLDHGERRSRLRWSPR